MVTLSVLSAGKGSLTSSITFRKEGCGCLQLSLVDGHPILEIENESKAVVFPTPVARFGCINTNEDSGVAPSCESEAWGDSSGHM